MVPYAVAGFLLIVGASFVRGARDKYPDFCVGAAIPIAVLLLLPLGYVTGLLCPRTLDATLRQTDLALHFGRLRHDRLANLRQVGTSGSRLCTILCRW